MSGATELLVTVAGKQVGLLAYEDYQYSFRYDAPSRLTPTTDLVSLTMPVRAASYDTQVLPPPFQMLLPEGDLLLQLRARFGKALDLDNDFNLLRLVGHNTIGRLGFRELDSAFAPAQPMPAIPALETLLRHPDARALLGELIDIYGVRSGIGGMQPKALLALGSQLTLTSGDVILKAAGSDFPQLPVNEYFCLQASRAAEIPTVACRLSDSCELLLVDRFDRRRGGQPLAFEEICALLQLGRHGKYSGSYEQIAEVIQQIPCQKTPTALEQFFRSVALAMTVRNGDAHLKNFGVTYESSDRVMWSPAYDLVTTTVYRIKDTPALELAGRKTWPGRPALEHFGLHACNLRRAAVRRSLEAVAGAVHDTVRKLRRFVRREPEFAALASRMIEQWRQGLEGLR